MTELGGPLRPFGEGVRGAARTFLGAQVTAPIRSRPSAGCDETRPTTRSALLHWASRHRVRDRLSVPARRALREALPQLAADLRRAGYQLTVADLAWGDDRQSERVKPLVAREGLERVRDAAWSYLRDQAESIREGLEKEERRRLAPPASFSDPTLRALNEWLSEGRASVRRFTLPRDRTRIKVEKTFFTREPPVFHYFEDDEAGSLLEWTEARHPRVIIPLGDWRRAPVQGSCTCAHGGSACPHILTALDLLIDLLADEKQDFVRFIPVTADEG